QARPLWWPRFSLVGFSPLFVVALARRGPQATRRYTAVRDVDVESKLDPTKMAEPWRPEYRRNLIGVGIMHFFRYAALSAAVFWFPFFAQQEVGLSLSVTGLYIAAAGVVGVVGFLVAGRAMDRWGRKPMFTLYMLGALLFGVLLFQTHSPGVMLPE